MQTKNRLLKSAKRKSGLAIYFEALKLLSGAHKFPVAIYTVSSIFESFVTIALYPVIAIGMNQKGERLTSWMELLARFDLDQNQIVVVHLIAFLILAAMFSWAKWRGEAGFSYCYGLIELQSRTTLANALNVMKWEYFALNANPSSAHALVTCCDKMSEGMRHFLSLIANAAGAVCLGLTLIGISPVFGTIVILSVAAVVFLQKSQRHQSAIKMDKLGQSSQKIISNYAFYIKNLKYCRSTELGSKISRVTQEAQMESIGSFKAVHSLFAKQRFVLDMASFLAIALILGGVVIFAPNQFSKASIFLAILYRLLPKFVATNLYYQLASLNIPFVAQWQETLEIATCHKNAPTGGMDPPKNLDITFNNVSLTFPGQVVPALNQVSVRIAEKSFVIILGESGSGKSTLFDMLTGLIKPSAGRIDVGETPLAMIDAAKWIQRISVVQQQTPLLHGSIRENIAPYDPNPELEWIEECARLANAHDFICRLPQQYNTIVGENLTLSGGEAQRLALARALYSRPAILLLDEPTSALDTKSEEIFIESLRGLSGKLTILMTTHRIPTIALATHVMVLNRGTVIQQGHIADLLGQENGPLSHIVGRHDKAV